MSETRKELLVKILTQLHHGASPEDVKEDFNRHFASVSAIEIAMMEQEIINGPGPITFEDVLKLCNVHAEVFRGKIDPKIADSMDHPGHPVRIFKDENYAFRACLMRIDNIIQALAELPEDDPDLPDIWAGLCYQYRLLGEFDRHYERKEKLFFPILEKKGYTAPPKVMWAKDDEIRDLYRKVNRAIGEKSSSQIIDQLHKDFKEEFEGMIFKEEAILLNILLESFEDEDWKQIAKESVAYGYAIIQPDVGQWLDEKEEREDTQMTAESTKMTLKAQVVQTTQIETNEGTITLSWQPKQTDKVTAEPVVDRQTPIAFNHGTLSLDEIQLIMDHLSLEVTFVDKNDIFRYFNDAHPAEEMIFKRTPSQIGRSIELCHPPKAWPKVSQLLEDLRNKRRSSESMWFKRGDGVYVYVTYTGVYDKEGEFQGVLETVQDIQKFVNLESPMKFDLSPLEES